MHSVTKRIVSPHRENVNHVSDGWEDVSSAWQWREGRLLAYELILQFLIKNHLLYTFGTAQPATPAHEQCQPQARYSTITVCVSIMMMSITSDLRLSMSGKRN